MVGTFPLASMPEATPWVQAVGSCAIAIHNSPEEVKGHRNSFYSPMKKIALK